MAFCSAIRPAPRPQGYWSLKNLAVHNETFHEKFDPLFDFSKIRYSLSDLLLAISLLSVALFTLLYLNSHNFANIANGKL